MKSNRYKYSIRFLVVLLIALLPSLSLASEAGSISTAPANIQMGAQYDGIRLKVNGTVPAGSDVIVRFTGATGDLHLRQKGKVFGLLWMNIGKVTLKNVPKVYLIDSSRPLDEIGSVAAPFRLGGLRDAIKIEKEGGSENIDIPNELLLLKKHEKLYNEESKGVHLGQAEGPFHTFSADLAIPSALAPGQYQVEAIAIKDGAIAGRYTTTIEAELIGFPKWLSNLAFEKSLLYGILATLIAIFTGLAIGIVFQSKGAH
jgi:uncharacterized protein (TIGR02186 family)